MDLRKSLVQPSDRRKEGYEATPGCSGIVQFCPDRTEHTEPLVATCPTTLQSSYFEVFLISALTLLASSYVHEFSYSCYVLLWRAWVHLLNIFLVGTTRLTLGPSKPLLQVEQAQTPHPFKYPSRKVKLIASINRQKWELRKTMKAAPCNGEIYNLYTEGSSHKNFHNACNHCVLVLQVLCQT